MDLARSKSMKSSRGQSLVETALMLPLLLMLTLNVVNLGYFFLVMVNLTGAARTSTLFAIEGPATPAATALPAAWGTGSTPVTKSVAYITFQDLTGSLWNPTSVTVQVCTEGNLNSSTKIGTNGSGNTLRTNCVTCSTSGGGCGTVGSGSPVPNVDPEAPSLRTLLNRVDISYTFHTLIPGTIFNIPLQASPLCNSGTCTFTRHAEMRSMQ
jgi:Flp pilus assembly protein TadG